MVNWAFWGGIVVGWVAASWIISPVIKKYVSKDLNTLVMNNPMAVSKFRMQASPQEIMNLRMQGVMI